MSNHSMRFSAEDERLVSALKTSTGLELTGLFKLCLRVAAKEFKVEEQAGQDLRFWGVFQGLAPDKLVLIGVYHIEREAQARARMDRTAIGPDFSVHKITSELAWKFWGQDKEEIPF